MKYMRKTAASSFIVVLASFVGGLCLHPMAAQAMGSAPMMMNMAGEQALADESAPARNASEASSRNDAGGDAVSGNDNAVTAWNLCVVNCASQPAQAVAAKKFSVDCGADLLADGSDNQLLHSFVFSSGATDLTGTHPPSPDILSSVFKKE